MKSRRCCKCLPINEATKFCDHSPLTLSILRKLLPLKSFHCRPLAYFDTFAVSIGSLRRPSEDGGRRGQYCIFFESVLAKKVRTDPAPAATHYIMKTVQKLEFALSETSSP